MITSEAVYHCNVHLLSRISSLPANGRLKGTPGISGLTFTVPGVDLRIKESLVSVASHPLYLVLVEDKGISGTCSLTSSLPGVDLRIKESLVPVASHPLYLVLI